MLDVFSALARYNSAIDENYLTEAFVFVINSLLQREPVVAREVLNHICVVDDDFAFTSDKNISVTTQETTEQGRPDIKISTPDKLIYIEVKHDSSLGDNQVQRYKQALESSSAQIKHVVLLTRFAIDVSEQEETPYKHIRWFEVYNWFSGLVVKDSVADYLLDSFNSFLEEKQMSLQRVGWEYINGVPAFNNLVNMLEVAIQAVSISIHSKTSGWAYKGFWLDKKEYVAVIRYTNHMIITFELTDKTKYIKDYKTKTNYELREGKERLWYRLNLESCHFFSLDKDEQLEQLTQFIKSTYEEVKKMRLNVR